MKKIIGYLLALVGLLVLAANSAVGRGYFTFLEEISSAIVVGVGMVFVILGVVVLIVMNKGGGSKWGIGQVENEVPIYHGDGKKRKIVGYKVEK